MVFQEMWCAQTDSLLFDILRCSGSGFGFSDHCKCSRDILEDSCNRTNGDTHHVHLLDLGGNLNRRIICMVNVKLKVHMMADLTVLEGYQHTNTGA